jgi:hypothetical protein
MAWKYIVFRRGLIDYPVIFPASLHFGELHRAMDRHEAFGYQPPQVVSAGTLGDVIALDMGGEAPELGVTSHPHEDELLLNDYATKAGGAEGLA